jgi:hypothetical protein
MDETAETNVTPADHKPDPGYAVLFPVARPAQDNQVFKSGIKPVFPVKFMMTLKVFRASARFTHSNLRPLKF